MYVNLLSPDYQRRQLVRLRLWQWAIIWAVVLPVLAMSGLWQWSQYHASMGRLAEIERQYAPIQQIEKQNGEILRQLQEVRQREQLMGELDANRSAFDLLGRVSRAAAGCGGDISVQEFVLNRPKSGGSRGGTIADAPPRGSLTLRGVGMDNLAIARFISLLREGQGFEQVQLKSTVPMEVSGVNVRSYVLECIY